MAEWITDRLPTAADADEDGDVQILTRRDIHPTSGHYAEYECIVPGQPWWSRNAAARAAQTPAPAPAPARVVTAMTAAGTKVIAACNDGTVWIYSSTIGGNWTQVVSIPQPEDPNA